MFTNDTEELFNKVISFAYGEDEITDSEAQTLDYWVDVLVRERSI